MNAYGSTLSRTRRRGDSDGSRPRRTPGGAGKLRTRPPAGDSPMPSRASCALASKSTTRSTTMRDDQVFVYAAAASCSRRGCPARSRHALRAATARRRVCATKASRRSFRPHARWRMASVWRPPRCRSTPSVSRRTGAMRDECSLSVAGTDVRNARNDHVAVARHGVVDVVPAPRSQGAGERRLECGSARSDQRRQQPWLVHAANALPSGPGAVRSRIDASSRKPRIWGAF